jgi:hypothetical protein
VDNRAGAVLRGLNDDEGRHAVVELEAAVDADDRRSGEVGTDLARRSRPWSDSLGFGAGDMFRMGRLVLALG